jgi:hypothetical protein
MWITILVVIGVLVLLSSALLGPSLARLAQYRHVEPHKLGLIPVANTYIVATLAGASPFSILLMPFGYVWWDCWSEIAFDQGHEHPDRFAVGMLVPVLNIVLLARFVRRVTSLGRQTDALLRGAAPAA